MPEQNKRLHQSKMLEGAANRMAFNARARAWLTDHGHRWDGAVDGVNMRGNATGVEGCNEAMGVIEQAIMELRENILVRADELMNQRESDVRNTIDIVRGSLDV